MILTLLSFIFALALMIFSAEKLVKGIISVSAKFGITAFLLTTIFIGFDPENLAAGASGTINGLYGIAIGSILGAVMVPTALSFGLTSIITKIQFKKISKKVLLIPVLSVLLLFLLSIDGVISRIDGIILISCFIFIVYYLFKNKGNVDMKPEGELKESLEEVKKVSKLKAIIILILSLAGIVLGSEIMVESAKPIIQAMGINDTLFGMTILAFLISIEELAKQLPAAIKGRVDISYGNMMGSIIHFILLNAGIIALINPILISAEILTIYFPIVIATMVFISLVMLKKSFPRWAGTILVLSYIGFVLIGFF